jgi:hypothetical protein
VGRPLAALAYSQVSQDTPAVRLQTTRPTAGFAASRVRVLIRRQFTTVQGRSPLADIQCHSEAGASPRGTAEADEHPPAVVIGTGDMCRSDPDKRTPPAHWDPNRPCMGVRMRIEQAGSPPTFDVGVRGNYESA